MAEVEADDPPAASVSVRPRPRPGRDTASPLAASDFIAEMWRDREQGPSMPPPGAVPPAPATSPASPRPGAGIGQSALIGVVAGVVLLALVAGGLYALRGGGALKATYVREADAVCASKNPQVVTIVKPATHTELAAAAGAVAASLDGQLSRLHGMRLPAGSDGGLAKGIVAGMEATSHSGKVLRDAAASNNDALVVTATTAFAGEFNATTVQAKAFGFSACAVGLQAGVDNVFGGAHDVVKTAYVTKANALCTSYGPEINALSDPTFKNLADALSFLDRSAALVKKMATDIGALPVPPGDEQTVKDMLAAMSAFQAKVLDERAAAARGDRATVLADADQLGPLGGAVDDATTAYGLGVCGS